MTAAPGAPAQSAHSPIEARRRFARELLTEAVEHHGMMLVVEGLSGAGKTFLLRELIQAAVAAGHQRTAFLRADEIEHSEPFSFIERFVAGCRIPDWSFSPDPQTDPFDVGRACVQQLLAPNAPAMRVIVIDDAQWIDPQSQRVLRYLIPRVTGSGIMLAFGVRTPHSPESFGEFLSSSASDDPVDVLHHIEPLTVADISALVLERHGAGISTHTARRILDETEGSFLAIDSVLSSLTDSEIAKLHLAWDIPFELGGSDRLVHRFEQLGDDAQRTCEIVCLAGHELTPEVLSAAARILDEPVSIDEAIDADVLIEAGIGSTIMPRHALLAKAISAAVAPSRARDVFRALAEATQGHRSLRHSLRGAESWSPALRDRVSAYVAQATESGNFAAASEVLRDALSIAVESEDRAPLLIDLALVHMEDKTGYLVLDLLDEIERLPPGILHEFVAIVLGAHQPGRELPIERAQRLLMTPPTTADDRAVLALFAFMSVILTMRTGDRTMVPQLIGHAKMLIEQSPADPAELENPRLAWMVAREGHLLVLDAYLTVQDQVLAEMQRVKDALPGLIERIEGLPDQSLKVDAIVAVAGALIAVGDLSAGRAYAQQGVDMLGRVREPWAASTARVIFADCLVLEGEYEAASELMELTEELSYTTLDVETRASWAALRVIVAAVTGRQGEEVHIARARRQRATSWEGYGPDLTLLAECELARARGDAEAVLAASSGDWAERLANTRHGFLTFRAHALINTGRLEEAAELIERLAEWRGVRWQEYWGSLSWLRARLAQASGDAAAALWHYRAAAEQPVPPLAYGLTLTDFGEFLLQTGEEADGREQLREAIRRLETIGAKSYLPRARRLLEADPAGPSADRDGLLALLTARERQIAEHLANGRSNNQIAESLVVSVTTVRSHVSNVLRKLRLTSRGEVARLLREGR